MITLALTSMLLACVTSQQSSTGNRHVINRTMYVGDKLEYDIESLFEKVSADLRYDQVVPESEQHFTTTPKIVQLDSITIPEKLKDCSKFKKLNNRRFFAYCLDNSLLIFEFSHHDKSFLSNILNVTECVPEDAKLLEYTWDQSEQLL